MLLLGCFELSDFINKILTHSKLFKLENIVVVLVKFDSFIGKIRFKNFKLRYILNESTDFDVVYNEFFLS